MTRIDINEKMKRRSDKTLAFLWKPTNSPLSSTVD